MRKAKEKNKPLLSLATAGLAALLLFGIGESIVTLTFTGKSTENTRTKLVNLLSEAYTERVKKWQ